MKTDTKRGAAKLEKPEGGKILKNMRRLGSYHFHTKVPFDQGPKFKNRKYTLEWQRGWKQAKAYEQGYKAGLTGDKAKKNPYRDKSKMENIKLSRWWEYGRQAVTEVVKAYSV